MTKATDEEIRCVIWMLREKPYTYAADVMQQLLDERDAASAEGAKRDEAWKELRDTILHEHGPLEVNYILDLIDSFDEESTVSNQQQNLGKE